MRNKYKKLLLFLFFLMSYYKVNAEENTIELEAENSTINIEKESIDIKNGVTLKVGDIKIKSDTLKKLEGENILFSRGNVIFSQGDQVIKAKEVLFNIDSRKAKILDSESYNTDLKLRFGGKVTRIEDINKISIKKGWVTTSPNENPSYKMLAEELEIYPNRKLIAKNMSINIKGKNYLKIPYYVTSLANRKEKATLFPYIGSNRHKGFHVIWGFDYFYKNSLDGFVDFEISEKQKFALKTYNEYKLTDNNKGVLFVDRFAIPIKNKQREWDFEINHNFKHIPKNEKSKRKFYHLGNGIWNLGYKNTTTNLMYTADGELLRNKNLDFINKYKHMDYFDIKLDQEIGKNGEFNFDYYWTKNRESLKELTEINDDIVYLKDLDPAHTDVDLYKRIKYTNGNNDFLIKVHTEDFFDVNPGYVGDENSYKKRNYYLVDIKSSKLKFEHLTLDQDKYESIIGMKERDNNDPFIFKNKNNRWLKTIEYDKRKETLLTFGNYYFARKNRFFNDRKRNWLEYLRHNLYFSLDLKHVEKKYKEYIYDYTRDNYSFDNFFRNNSNFLDDISYNDNRNYKIYDNAEKAKKVKEITNENYKSNKLNLGNMKIQLNPNIYIGTNYSIENINYSDVYVPNFSGIITESGKIVDKGIKKEDKNSKTGYKIEYDENGQLVKRNPSAKVQRLETKLFTKIFDNTEMLNNDYDLKITNEIDFAKQFTSGKDVIYKGYDIVKIPTDSIEFKNDFNFSLGNINFNHKIEHKKDNHFKNGWLKGIDFKNFLKLDIDNKRYVSFEYENNKKYEFENYKDKKIDNLDIQYGYKSEYENEFLYRYKEKRNKYYPYNIVLGWNNNDYKEKNIEKIGEINYNEWGIEYIKRETVLNDLFYNRDIAKPLLKSKLKTYMFSLIYDTSKKKSYTLPWNHYLKIGVGTGKKQYRDMNKTILNLEDDYYVYGKDYINLGFLYKYENNENYLENESPSKDVRENKNIDNLFNLDDFNKKIERERRQKKYFEFGVDLQLDGSNSRNSDKIRKMNRLNDLIIKVEGGYLQKIFASYRFIMEKPDRIYRSDISRKSKYNYRRHDFEIKYSFGKEKEKPWWIGAKIEYVQNGAIKKISSPEVYESSNEAKKVNRITSSSVTLSHRVENFEWEVGTGVKWDKPRNKRLGYYPVVTFKFSLTPFPDKSVEGGYTGGRPRFGVGL